MSSNAPKSPDSASRKSSDVQLNRACEACRVSKVRCLVDPGSGSQCQRCAKAGRQCVFAPPAKRRQRKRTDVRVAELERELKQLTSLLKPHSTISPAEGSDHDSIDEDEPTGTPEKELPTYAQNREGSNTQMTTNNPVQWPSGQDQPRSQTPDDLLKPTDKDIIDRGVISEELAERLLNVYRQDLFEEYPGMPIAADTTVDQLRRKKPALFLAAMAAASHSMGAGLSNKLHEELVYYFARSLFIQGEKSIQHIQAIFVSVAYYSPPNNPAQMQIYQYCNLAASMALELGLASKPRTHEQLPKRAIRSLQRIASADELLENCRTILQLYTLIAGLSMRFRRPNILLFNAWMAECEAMLKKSPKMEDKRTIAWLRLQRIADEANTAFGFDDASTSFTLSELRMHAILKIFERRMMEWKQSIPEDVMTNFMLVEYYQNMMAMWEFAMDGGRYDAPEFRNRHMTLPALDDDSCPQPETLFSRSALQLNATIMCISAAHSILDCFLQVPIPKLQKAPSVIFVRVAFALVALLKVDYAVGTDADGMGEIMDSKTLKIDYYLDAALKMIAEAVEPQKCRLPQHWNFVFREKLKKWHDEHQEWRRAGKHLQRSNKKAKTGPSMTTTTTPSTSGSSMLPPQTNYTAQIPVSADALQKQPQPQMQDYNIDNAYPSWQPSGFNFSAVANPSQTVNEQAFGPEMADFSAAFQNGDLYLWDDINDNYGGWIPQDGTVYSDIQFGGMNMSL